MADVELQDIPDLVAGTLRHLGKQRFQQIAQNLQRYEVVGRWFKKDKVQFDHGSGIQRNIMSNYADVASHVGMTHSISSVTIPQLMDNIQINWRRCFAYWPFNYMEILTNRADSLVFNVIKPRRIGAMLAMAAELEKKAWQVPSTTDKVNPYGLPYWIVYNATTGFNGGYPGSHTTVGGVNLTDSPNFKNYTANYTTVNKADLLKKMRTGHRATRWQAPISNEDYRKQEFSDYRYYTNETTIASLEDLGEGQNENLGRDLAPYGASSDLDKVGSTLLFRKHPIIHIPQLDDTAVFTACTNPVYQVDHSTFYPVCLKGDYMREAKPRSLESQPDMYRVDCWLSYNYLCVDRRRNAVYATA